MWPSSLTKVRHGNLRKQFCLVSNISFRIKNYRKVLILDKIHTNDPLGVGRDPKVRWINSK